MVESAKVNEIMRNQKCLVIDYSESVGINVKCCNEINVA